MWCLGMDRIRGAVSALAARVIRHARGCFSLMSPWFAHSRRACTYGQSAHRYVSRRHVSPVCGTLGDCRTPNFHRHFATPFTKGSHREQRHVVSKGAWLSLIRLTHCHFPPGPSAQLVHQRSLDHPTLSDWDGLYVHKRHFPKEFLPAAITHASQEDLHEKYPSHAPEP